ncbi:MAG: aminotransferase class III-fold pyridoxal phosphate-dependent enzyme [Halolamina sp.]|uniref:aspartate aminotransferase family protein n=1 Tax=Halolamina sp. TaxID=1940283 RepID=UPI002FC311C9
MTDEGFVFSEKPLAIASGEGMALTGENGTDYLDFGASYACTPLGHSPPDVVEAIREQAGDLLYVQGSYPVAVRTALRERLAEAAPGDLSKVWLCNSGTEANEAALKFARSATGREKVVATKRAFHGRTLGALSLTWKDAYRDPFGPLPGAVEFVPYGDDDALAGAVDDDTAAVFLEPIQGEGGVHCAGDSYLQTAREQTAEAGAALVLDEIQTGLGRTGTLWACEAAGVVPDIITTAKGLASGLPLGATLCADWVAEDAGNHGSTFAGNPLVAAAADATLAGLLAQNVPENAADVGSYLQSELRAAVDAHDLPVRDVRGQGLMVGIEVKRGAMGVLRDLALNERILALPAGRSVVRLLPPLVAETQHADTVVEALVEVLT